jgi:hypothetical protein
LDDSTNLPTTNEPSFTGGIESPLIGKALSKWAISLITKIQFGLKT